MSTATERAPLVIISPVRNEAGHIRRTLDSVVAQEFAPTEWIIVDDGSTDSTADIVRAYSRRYPFIRLVEKPDRGRRHVGAGVIETFEYGRAHIKNTAYLFIAKLDGDMSFGPRYIRTMIEALNADPSLAAVSGQVFRPEGDRLVPEFHIKEHVAGQFKFYRRSAFEAIGGFEPVILWDGIDIHKCRINGWSTQRIDDPEARLLHHRQMGSSDRSVYHGRIRLGRGMYFMGYSPAYALASSLFRMREKPYIAGGALMFLAYCYAALMRDTRFSEQGFRQALRSWQHQRLRAKLSELLRRPTSAFRGWT